jgi:NAD(P)-dependent dehydrogenase (short-subunit alcohol dehydrogenase family)
MTAALVPLLKKAEDPNVVVIASIAGLAIQRALGSITYGTSKVS